MEKHFNLFQSYNSGHEKDLVKVVQLEDNITRALLCVLSNLDLNLQHTLLSQLLPDAFLERNEIINYDLQNPSAEIDFSQSSNLITLRLPKVADTEPVKIISITLDKDLDEKQVPIK